MNVKFWQALKTPHPASLDNLRKIADFCTANNFIMPTQTTSAYAISRATGISYTQVLNLIKKPGFVAVRERPTDRPSFFYAFAQLGMQYPEKFPPNMSPLPREILLIENEPTISNPEVAAEVERAANHNSNAQPQMDFSTASVPAGQLKKSQLANAWNTVFEQGIVNQSRTPAQIAGFAYKLAEAIHNGTITLED